MSTIPLVAIRTVKGKNFFSAMAYSSYLKSKREAAGFSQQKLADLITARGHKVSAGNVSNIERAYYKRQDGSETQPDKMFVILAAEILGDDVNRALRQADYSVRDDFAERLESLSPERRVLALRQINAILDSLTEEHPAPPTGEVVPAKSNIRHLQPDQGIHTKSNEIHRPKKKRETGS